MRTVEDDYMNETRVPSSEIDINHPANSKLLLCSILCNDSTNVDGVEIGDPTETALINMGSRLGVYAQDVREKYPRESENPFDSDRKLMATKHTIDGKHVMIVKGAVDVLLNRMESIHIQDEVRKFEQVDRSKIEAQNQEFSRGGLRVLAFAY